MSERRHEEHERYCAAVEDEVGRFVELVSGADPTTVVPTCPGWTIADLMKHHGTTYRWQDEIVRRRLQERIWSRDVPLGLPDDAADYPAWVATGAKSLLGTLRATDPETRVWTPFGTGDRVRFWPRRVLFEAVIHRADAEIALGRTPHIDPAIAADGIEELLTIIPGARWVVERFGEFDRPGATLHLHAIDSAGEWLITTRSDGLTWARGHGTADVAVRGVAGDLLLMVYGRLRVPDARLTVFGDHELLTSWLEKAAL
ncbi:maleylpyruvate isomerase family mycothiol-dependent enzyme [Micromonospora sp. NPDC049679]|uniref:maleylpyruvate isomerase family mycothiol-dependent enzyme n=1 Tax=Micromonospora sp. NPDC049679 TaxID=3155920 RepID=UPI0033DE5F63